MTHSNSSFDVLVVEFLVDDASPIGGGTRFLHDLIQTFGSRLAVLGLTNKEEHLGQWVVREVDGHRIRVLALDRQTDFRSRPLLPGRLRRYLQLRKNRDKILESGLSTAIVTSPEYLMAVHNWGWSDLCFLFLGVENPLGRSRYPGGRFLESYFDRRLFRALRSCNTILAHADEKAIEGLCRRSRGSLTPDRVHSVPTFADTSIYRPMDRGEARRTLDIPPDVPMFVSVGRLNRVKGWKLILDAFSHVLARIPGAQLVFVGDGEDRSELERAIAAYGIGAAVAITGVVGAETVALFLNASNVFVCGSWYEGWSYAFVEALSCGIPIVSTDVSGASSMIVNGRNGMIIQHRDPSNFAEAMLDALALQDARAVSLQIAEQYSLKHMKERWSQAMETAPGRSSSGSTSGSNMTAPTQTASRARFSLCLRAHLGLGNRYGLELGNSFGEALFS